MVVGDKGSLALSRPMPDILEFAITHITTPLNFPTGTKYFIFSLFHRCPSFRTIERLRQNSPYIQRIQKRNYTISKKSLNNE